MQTLPTPRDWFDDFWDQNVRTLPAMFRSNAVKEVARKLLDELLKHLARKAGTPDGVKAIVAFARIAAILKGSQGVLDAPDPSPDQVVEAVQRLVDKVKP
jgi:hypothetical protein